jgi:deazaflavin-dependent oxidoreductase (nitroreductase family)
MEDDLVWHGRVAGLTTRGRHSGQARHVTVGYVESGDGALLVAATEPDADWALNLLEDPACEVEVGRRRYAAVAEPLTGADHAAAVRELILRYGTPSEGLGRGPSFRLRPQQAEPG